MSFEGSTGVLSGKPVTPGPYYLVVTVTDSTKPTALTGAALYLLTVNY